MTSTNAAAGALAALLVIGTAGVALLASNSETESRFLNRCEERMLAALRSPATYQRISVSDVQHRYASPTEIATVTPLQRESFLDSSATPTDRTFRSADLGMLYIRVTYDAANAYGTPIRGAFTCSQMVYGKGDLNPDAWPVLDIED